MMIACTIQRDMCCSNHGDISQYSASNEMALEAVEMGKGVFLFGSRLLFYKTMNDCYVK